MDFSDKDFVIIAGSGRADAQLLEKLMPLYPDALVIRYHVRKLRNHRYYLHKFVRIGMITSVHIKLLAIYLIAMRWLSRNAVSEQAKQTYNIKDCDDEASLAKLVGERKYVLLTQALRLKDSFIRHRHVLQIVGGNYPAYSGDVALFWAWAQRRQEDYRYALVLRDKYFKHSTLVHSCHVALKDKETLHSIRMKGMQAVADVLPLLLPHPHTWMHKLQPHKTQPLNAPGLLTYLLVTRAGKVLKQIPAYAKR